MTSLTEVAKNFAESAKQQRERTDQDVRQEFKRLSDAIKKESASVEATYKNDMKGQHYKTVIWQTFSMIPILVAFALGVALTFMLTSGDRFKMVSTFKNDQGVWIRCPKLDENGRFCLIEESK